MNKKYISLKKSNKSTKSLYLKHWFKIFFIIIVIDRELCMIKNGDDTNVLGTIATFAPSGRQGWLRACILATLISQPNSLLLWVTAMRGTWGSFREQFYGSHGPTHGISFRYAIYLNSLSQKYASNCRLTRFTQTPQLSIGLDRIQGISLLDDMVQFSLSYLF